MVNVLTSVLHLKIPVCSSWNSDLHPKQQADTLVAEVFFLVLQLVCLPLVLYLSTGVHVGIF